MKPSNERSDPGPRRTLIDETEADVCTDLSGSSMTRYQDCDNALMCLLASPPQDGDVGSAWLDYEQCGVEAEAGHGTLAIIDGARVFGCSLVPVSSAGRFRPTQLCLIRRVTCLNSVWLCMSQFKNRR